MSVGEAIEDETNIAHVTGLTQRKYSTAKDPEIYKEARKNRNPGKEKEGILLLDSFLVSSSISDTDLSLCGWHSTVSALAFPSFFLRVSVPLWLSFIPKSEIRNRKGHGS